MAAAGQLVRQSATPGSDLDHDLERFRCQRVDDPRDRPGMRQEVLSEPRSTAAGGAGRPGRAACYTCVPPPLPPGRKARVGRFRRGRDGGAGGPSIAVASDRILLLNDDSFDREIQRRSEAILVDFWASWCAPCKAIAASLVELAEELDGRATVAMVDVDECGDLTNRFGILSVPTLVVFVHGRIADRLVGAAPKDEIRRMLLRHVAA